MTGLASYPAVMFERTRRLGDGLGALAGRRREAAAVVLGAVSALAFAPISAVPLLFVTLPALVILLDRAGTAAVAAWLGWLFGLGYFLVGLYWVGESFYAQDAVPAWGAPIAVAALSAGMAAYIAGAGLAYWLLCRPRASADGSRAAFRVVTFAACWAAFEWLRGVLFTGFPWNAVGSVWAASDVMVQSAALIGTYGLTLITVVAAASPVVLLDRGAGARALILPGVGLAILVAMLGYGVWRLAGAQVTVVPDTTLRIVQANIAQKDKWRRDLLHRNVARHIDLSNRSNDAGHGASPGRLIVIWPETAVPFFIGTAPARRRLITRSLPAGSVLITGVPRVEQDASPARYYNSLHVIERDGALLATYDKAHLVPFGEYLPLRGVLSRIGLDKLVAGASDFSAGPGRAALAVPGLPAASPLICYEAIFPGAVVPDDGGSGGRPGWLLNLTNDAWFGSSAGPHQHFAQSRLRAVEEGLPLVRAAGTGISAVVDPYGRVLASLALGSRGRLDHALPRPLARPPLYARFGDVPFFALIALVLAAAVYTRILRGES